MEEKNSDKTVLVTGAGGYLASHVIYYLLKEGYKIKGTVRDLTHPKKVEPIYDIIPERR
jgi:nucleoside-diphosphate-sugar epimerase